MRNLYVLFLFLFGMAHVALAQNASQYYYKHKTGVALENISSGATTVFASKEDDVVSQDIAFFPFTFGGTTYSSLKIAEDGLVVLGNANYTPYPYDNYFTQTEAVYNQKPAYPVLIPWGEDLAIGVTGSITYKVVGDAPYRKLVIQYNVFANEDYGDTNELTTPPTKNFQIWLSETYNQLSFVYGDVVYDWYNNANIGIAASPSDFISVNTADNSTSSTTMYSNEYGNSAFSPIGTYSKGMLPNKGYAYIFSPTEIKDEPTTPVIPVTATLSMTPAYPVANQHKHTIYLGYGDQEVKLDAQVTGGTPSSAGYTYSWKDGAGKIITAEASLKVSPKQTTTYSVEISDGKSTPATQSITVYVIDPREGSKFKVCKLGKTTICISAEAVATQLQGGALLGDCTVALVAPSSTSSANGGLNLRQPVGEAVASRAGFSVYPNPSSGEFTVQIPADMQHRTITIFDANGRMVARQKVGEDQQSVHIDLPTKKAGVYLVKLSGNGQVQTSKIIIK